MYKEQFFDEQIKKIPVEVKSENFYNQKFLFINNCKEFLIENTNKNQDTEFCFLKKKQKNNFFSEKNFSKKKYNTLLI
jgi:hypothetical protein